MPYLPQAPPRFTGEVTSNTQKQQYEFVNQSGSYVDASFVICHETYNECSYLTDTSHLMSTP